MKDNSAVLPFREKKNQSVLVTIWVLCLKTSTAGAFRVHFRVLNRKKVTGEMCWFRIGTSYG